MLVLFETAAGYAIFKHCWRECAQTGWDIYWYGLASITNQSALSSLSLSRYKLEFSPDKVDTMIVQAVGWLDDLDEELRTREWYGWHFPELGKILNDNVLYVKVIKVIGTRDHALEADLSDILSEEVEAQVKEAAEISMGTEIAEEDILNVQHLCDQICEIKVKCVLYWGISLN
ncbi:hypothetical protein R5R35_008825 [Gryllus longicercus]|uniref:NOSIC domain-containing protein n=1 Tax=Gryllus longicercus TaxID=2509291 RepID=A0AAN9YY87_9ORTH